MRNFIVDDCRTNIGFKLVIILSILNHLFILNKRKIFTTDRHTGAKGNQFRYVAHFLLSQASSELNMEKHLVSIPNNS